ncbi:hypothetical protein ACFL59_12015 [Planctomycetota bacterium]
MTLNLQLDPTTAEALARLAAAQGKTPEELAREAVAGLVREAEPHRPRALSPNFGRFRSGRTDTAERAEEILRDAAEKGLWP